MDELYLNLKYTYNSRFECHVNTVSFLSVGFNLNEDQLCLGNVPGHQDLHIFYLKTTFLPLPKQCVHFVIVFTSIMLKMASSSGWWLEEHTVFVDILIKKSLNVKTFSDLKIEQIFYTAKVLWVF